MEEKDDYIKIGDVKAALEDVFKGCTVTTPSTMGSRSFVAELSFDEYEIRVILSGKRGPERDIHFRFLQKVVPSGQVRPTKLIINEVRTTDPKELVRAIRGAREYLLGIVQAINRALKRKPGITTTCVEDLLRGD